MTDAVCRCGLAEIVSCYSRSKDSRETFAEQVGCQAAGRFEEILKDPEVEGVLVATPHSNHAIVASDAASAGKHVFVEKPLALTVEEANRIIGAVSKAGVALLVGHHRRRQGGTRKIRKMIEGEELGMIHQLEANFSNANGQVAQPGWKNDRKESPAGSMTGLGVHMLDSLVYLAGPVKQVFAFSKRLYGKSTLDDVTTVALEFEKGPLGHLGTAFVIPKICTIAACGTEASTWSEEEGSKFYLQKKDEVVRVGVPVEAGDALAEEMAEFAQLYSGWKETGDRWPRELGGGCGTPGCRGERGEWPGN